MKIYNTAEKINVYVKNSRKYFTEAQSTVYSVENGILTLSEYICSSVRSKEVWFDDRVCLVEIPENEAIYSFFPYQDKKITLREKSGCILNLEPEKVFCIINNKNKKYNGVYVSVIRDYPDKIRKSLAVFNSNKDQFDFLEYKIFNCSYISDSFYGLNLDNGKIVKVDNDLCLSWEYDPKIKSRSSKSVLMAGEIAISFIGPLKKNRQLIDGRSRYTFSGGMLIGLNDADGSLAWEREIPVAVDHYQFAEDILYVVSLNEIQLINPGTGELINTIDTETSEPFNRDFGPSVYVEGSYIYYCHYDDAVILIYDRTTLVLQRRIDLPEGYHAMSHNFHDEVSGKQYFSLANRTQYVAQGPVLEIDPANLDEELMFEQEPEMDIQLQTSPDNDAEKELVIHLTSASLNDALRFGEIHTRDEAQRYSYNYIGMTFQDRPFTPEPAFNGVIRFNYSGSDQPRDVVEEHLQVMEKRFAKWVEKEGFYSCVNNKELTRLMAIYVG